MVKVSTRAAFVLMYVVAATAALGLESSFHMYKVPELGLNSEHQTLASFVERPLGGRDCEL